MSPWVQSAAAVGSFSRHYQDMRAANTIGGDMYFHGKANSPLIRQESEMRRVGCGLSVLLVFGMSNTVAACPGKEASEVSVVLARGIDLNERFKRSVKAGDDAKYRDLRNQIERYGEESAMPCVRKAVQLLEREPNEALLRRLITFAISYENSADETVSEAMATVFASGPEALAQVLASLSPSRGTILLYSVESGWPSVARTLTPAKRQDRESRLQMIREAQAKSAAQK